MDTTSRYWKLVRIDAAGRCKTEENNQAKAFFLQQLSEIVLGTDTSDLNIQRQLLHLFYQERSSEAELCLRCFISSQIEQVCIQLAALFGKKHGFTQHELFPFVLENKRSSDKSFSTEILQSFDLKRGSLATWTTIRVKRHRELNAFLLENGVYLLSDWAILNDTSPKQLQQIFSDFYHLSAVEIVQACILLESYHAVYRRDRLKQRGVGSKGKCLLPTVNQLQEIAHLFQIKAKLKPSPEGIMTQLQHTAEYLRQYRICVRRGSPFIQKSLDDPNSRTFADRIQSSGSTKNSNEQDEKAEFLELYHKQFIDCLDQAMEQVTDARCTYLQHKDAQMAQQFITALKLFHCQGRAMSEIAPIVGLQAQYQVTRLLKLKNFRADIRHRMLEALHTYLLDKASAYVDPERLQALECQVEAAIDEQIVQVIQEAAAEASIAKTIVLCAVYSPRGYVSISMLGEMKMDEHLMNSDDVLLDFETLAVDAIALEPEHIEQAMQLCSQISNEVQQWQTYLNALALFGFQQWLKERAADLPLNLKDCSIFQRHYANAIPAVFNLRVGKFKLCLIAIGSLMDEQVTVPTLIDLPEFIAHFYVLLQVHEEQEQAIIRGFLRYDRLIDQHRAIHLQVDNNLFYRLPLTWFECEEVDSLLLYLRCLDPKGIPLPEIPTNRPATTLYTENVLQQTTQLAVNVALWLQDEMDKFTESLSWVLLPALAPASSWNLRSSTEELNAIVTKLMHNGMSISSQARGAYRDLRLAEIPLRLYVVTWSLPSLVSKEWTLLLVLGAQPDTELLHGIKLFISDETNVLVERMQDSKGAYLYARVVGAWNEKFLVTIASINGEALTLPPFTFSPKRSL